MQFYAGKATCAARHLDFSWCDKPARWTGSLTFIDTDEPMQFCHHHRHLADGVSPLGRRVPHPGRCDKTCASAEPLV